MVSIYISHELAQSLLSNNMANLTKSSELVAEVKRRLANNVYPGQSSPYINTTLKQSTRHKGQSNQWGQDAPTPKIERRNMRISGYNDGSKYNPGPGITAS